LHCFPPFRLDPKNEQLWRGSEEVRLRRKTFAVLRCLVEHPGELVTKAMLLDSVWPDVSVSVPLDGVAAKLSIASKAPTEQRQKANRTRGLKRPD